MAIKPPNNRMHPTAALCAAKGGHSGLAMSISRFGFQGDHRLRRVMRGVQLTNSPSNPLTS